MAHAVWTPIAREELEDILYYIAIEDGRPLTAECVYFELRDLADRQAKKPKTGHRYDGAPVGWLYVRHKRWLLFYQLHSEGIEVMRVVDGVRDLPKLLRD